jgi:hypothetical protein
MPVMKEMIPKKQFEAEKNQTRRKALNAVQVTIDVILIKTNQQQKSEPSSKFLYIPIGYSHLLKFNPIGKEIAPTYYRGLNTTGGGGR